MPRPGNKAGVRERPWREHLTSCVAPPRGPGLQSGLPQDTQVSLEVHFFVDTPRVDLDNLAKPLLDTLFEPDINQTNQEKLRDVAGVLFDIPDQAVSRLLLTKTLVSDRAQMGAVITATWSGGSESTGASSDLELPTGP